MKLKEMFAKDISRNIQGVVKIGQNEPEVAQNELDEYVVTRELSEHFYRFFENYRKGTRSQTDKIGVWISGFFGSGKSHFLKILSYILSGREYTGKRAVNYFDGKIADHTVLADMKAAGDVSADVILFNIDAKSDADSKANKDAIVKVFMKVFNEMQGFCGSMPWIAELERKMTVEGTYEAFKAKFAEIAGVDWERGREDFYFESDSIIKSLAATQKMSEDAARHWCESSEANYNLDITRFARKVREYVEFKSKELGKKHYVVFLCDELGQYMGVDGNLLLNLQTVVESLGTECGGRAWVVATGQEDISSIVKETKGGRDAFSKIIGRFDTRMPLSSANADEVIKKRLLAKTDASADLLRLLFAEKTTVIKNLISFSTDTPEKKLYADENDFIDVYPFVPYQFKLLQEVFTGIRQHGASGKHLSEGERSLLNAFQDAAMQFEDSAEGAIIPFDAFYRTIETFLDHNIRKVILNAQDNSRIEKHDIPVLKLLFMVKYIDDKCPANLENLATLMLQNLSDDRITLRKKIDQSLRRLEAERFIIRNGDRFIFLTDEEQDVNREIREMPVERSAIVEKVGDAALTLLFKENRKYAYASPAGIRYDFGFNTIIDDRARGAQKEEIGIRIVTPYFSPMGMYEDASLISMGENNIVVTLPDSLEYMEEMKLALQIDAYLRKNAGRKGTEALEEIVASKNRELKQRKDRCDELLAEALKLASIYVNGSKLDIRAKDPQTRINDAFKFLVETMYTKLHFISKHIATTEELRALLLDKGDQLVLDGAESTPNRPALEDVTAYIRHYAATNITVRTLLEYFGKCPYGWKEHDTIGVLLTLFKRQEVRLELSSQALTDSDIKVVDYVLKRDTNDRVVIKLRVKVTQQLLNNAKDLARDVFAHTSLPVDEDGIMAKFKELSRSELFDRRDKDTDVSVKDLLAHYEVARYPGKDVLEKGRKLFERIISVTDVRAFFDTLREVKEDLLDYEEDVADVRKFFVGQQPIYDKSLSLLDRYDKNRTYVLDEETIKVIGEIERITKLKSPYSEIHLLPELNSMFIERFRVILDEECAPIEAAVREDWEAVMREYTSKDLTDVFSEKIRSAFEDLLSRLSHAHNIFEAIAMKTESDRLKTRLIGEIANEAARRAAAKNAGDEEEAPPPRKVITVSFKTLFAGSPQASSVEEVDAIVKNVRQKLVAQLEDGATIQIV
jgi:hypothetical protein